MLFGGIIDFILLNEESGAKLWVRSIYKGKIAVTKFLRNEFLHITESYFGFETYLRREGYLQEWTEKDLANAPEVVRKFNPQKVFKSEEEYRNYRDMVKRAVFLLISRTSFFELHQGEYTNLYAISCPDEFLMDDVSSSLIEKGHLGSILSLNSEGSGSKYWLTKNAIYYRFIDEVIVLDFNVPLSEFKASLGRGGTVEGERYVIYYINNAYGDKFYAVCKKKEGVL